MISQEGDGLGDGDITIAGDLAMTAVMPVELTAVPYNAPRELVPVLSLNVELMRAD